MAASCWHLVAGAFVPDHGRTADVGGSAGMMKLARAGVLAMVAASATGSGPLIHAAPSSQGRLAPAVTLVQLRPSGAPCAADGQCKSYNCAPSLDIYWYCVDEGALCAMKGSEGFKIGQQLEANNQCYECKQGLGWQVCSSGPARGQRPGGPEQETRPMDRLRKAPTAAPPPGAF
jgi:hypothetical protein